MTRQAAPLRGKRENEIQSIDGVRTALQLMDEMNGGLLVFFKFAGLWAAAPLPRLHSASLNSIQLHFSSLARSSFNTRRQKQPIKERIKEEEKSCFVGEVGRINHNREANA